MGTYELKYSNTRKITPEELFINYYAEEIYKLKQFRTSTKLLYVNLDAKYEKKYLNMIVKINAKIIKKHNIMNC